MAWTTIKTFKDKENGVVIEKQHLRRLHSGNQTRYLVRPNGRKYFTVSRSQLFDLTDALNDLCDLLEKEEF